jgi:hypothetical protein
VAAVLSRYLAEAAARGFVWGEHDCMLFAADWVREVSGVDPAARWRGKYNSQWQAEALLATQGGMGEAMAQALSACNWSTVSVVALEAGDVVLAAPREGVVAARHVAGIAVDQRKVALLTQRGKRELVVAPVPVLRAWRYRG